MSGDLAVRSAGTLSVDPGQTFWTPEQRAALRQIGVDEASNGDLAVFLNYAQRTGLDPFSRQIYMIGRNEKQRDGTWGKKWTIQASIDGLRIIAQRSGDYAGQVGPEWCGADGQWHDVWLDAAQPAAARVGVLRRGFSQPLYAVALMREYVGTDRDGKPTRMWAEKGALMLAKCAEALALRKAFPNDLSGVYTAEEMSSASLTDAAAVTTGQADAPHQADVAPRGSVAHPAAASDITDAEVIEDSDAGADVPVGKRDAEESRGSDEPAPASVHPETSNTFTVLQIKLKERFGSDRAAVLAWVSTQVGRPIASTKDLDAREVQVVVAILSGRRAEVPGE